jgi:hypothetical protein
MEYANKGDLMNYIHNSQTYIKENIIWRVIADVSQGIYLVI